MDKKNRYSNHIIPPPLKLMVTYGTSVNQPYNINKIPFENIVEHIKIDQNLKNTIKEIQKTKDKKKRDELKIDLPYFNMATFKGSRADENVISISHLVFDIDDLEEFQLFTTRSRLNNSISSNPPTKFPHIMCVFVSPSGKGLKFIVPLDQPITHKINYKDVYDYYREYYENMLGLPHDAVTKDMSRACFLSHDPQIYYNPLAPAHSVNEALTAKKAEREKKKAEQTRLAEKAKKALKTLPTEKNNKIIDKIRIHTVDQIINMISAAPDGERHAARLKAGHLAGGAVAGGILAENDILEQMKAAAIANTDSNPEKMLRTLQDAVEHGKKTPLDIEGEIGKYVLYCQNFNSGMPGEIIPFKSAKNDHFESSEKETAQDDKSFEFWYWKEMNKKGDRKLYVNRAKLLEFLEKSGFKRFKLGKQDYIFAHVKNNIAKEVRTHHIKTYVIDYIKSLIKHEDQKAVYNTLLSGIKIYFSRDLMEALPCIAPVFNRATRNTAFFYYQNCYVEVTKDNISTGNYQDLPGLIWKDQIVTRDFKKLKDEDWLDCFYNRFYDRISREDKNEVRKYAFVTATGYLLHGYKDKSNARAIICVDEKIPQDDNEANGGTGKGIFFNGICQLKNGIIKDGKSFNHQKNFLYQDVNLDTEILIFDEAPKKFPFDTIFSTITEDLPIEKKNRDVFIIPFQDSPKIIMTTNFTIQGRGASYERRKFELEFSDFYSESFTPKDDFQHILFEDWNSDEWRKFDNFMINCCQGYLAEGLVDYQKVNLEERKLIDESCREFIEFADDFIELNKTYAKKVIFEAFQNQYKDFLTLKQRTFTKWLRLYAKKEKLKKIEKKSNGEYFIAFVEAEKQTEMSF